MSGGPLRVYTARVSYGGADHLNITRRTAEKHRHANGEAHPGEPFAPSRAILNPALDLFHNTGAVLAFAKTHPLPGDAEAVKFAAIVQRAAWALYAEAYRLEMRESYRAHRAAWDALLARAEVTLCCFCTDAAHCHRTVLARDLLSRLGAIYAGEREVSRG